MSKSSAQYKRQKTVKPISSQKEIGYIRTAIGTSTRDLLLFDLALETGVAANQLLALRIKDLEGLDIGQQIKGLNGKQDRVEPVVIGPKTYQTFKQYIKENNCIPDDPLFRSRKGNRAVSLPSASRLVKSWFDKVGLQGMSGFLSIRKTWELFLKNEIKPDEIKTTNQPLGASYPVNTIKPQTTQEMAYKELEHAIVTARIKPGEKLVTEELARQMGISRIPVREAIGRLEARNFVTVQPKKGSTVNELSERNLNEILEIRLMLECRAARETAMSAPKELVEKLLNLNNKYIASQKKNQPERTLYTNREFHFTIYQASGMPILVSMIQHLWDQVSPYYHLMFRQTISHDPKTGHTYHQHIIDGITEKDGDKVSKWIATDLSASTKFVINVMRSMRITKND